MNNNKKILFIGGTRFFGPLIVRGLISAGYQVTILTRGNNKVTLSHPLLQTITCDRKDEHALSDAMKGRKFDTVIDNICYQQNDAEAAVSIFTGRCKLYIFTSSVMTYLNLYLSGRFLTEKDFHIAESIKGMDIQYEPYDISYALNKRKCEEIFLNSDSFKCVALRLQNVVGENDFSGKSGAIPMDLLKKKFVLPAGNLDDTYQQVYVEDLVKIYLKMVTCTPEILAPAYNVASAPISICKYVDIVKDACNIVNIEWVEENIKENADIGKPFPRNVCLDTSLIQQDLGICFSDYSSFLPHIVRWYSNNA